MWPGGFVIITEVRGIGEHLLLSKRMHSRRKSIPTKGIKGPVHKKKRSIKRDWGLLITLTGNLKGMYGHRYKLMGEVIQKC